MEEIEPRSSRGTLRFGRMAGTMEVEAAVEVEPEAEEAAAARDIEGRMAVTERFALDV